MTTTQSTEDERDIVDTVTRAWPVLTPVIITSHGCEITGPRDELLGYGPDYVTYGHIVAHRIRTGCNHDPQRFIVVRQSDGIEYHHEIHAHESGEISMYAAWIERDGVTEAFPSDPLAAYESNPEHFGDLRENLVMEGAILPE